MHERTLEKDQARDEFLTQPVSKLIGKHAVPAVASMLFMALYQIADGIMVGRSLGPEALASVNILYPIFALLSGVGVMIGVGGNARIAVLLGAGDKGKASSTLGLITSLGVGLGLAASILSAVLMPQVLGFLGTSGQMGHYAGEYFRGVLPFFPFMLLSFILGQSIRNDGQPALASVVMAGCALLNIALDYLFLFVLNFGISGAALATGLSQTVGAAICVGYFVLKTLRKHPGLVLAKPDATFGCLQAVMVNGSSELFNSLAAGVTTFLFNRMILFHVGPMGIAAFTLVQYLLMVGWFFVSGIGSGTQPIFSYNHGAGMHHRVRETLWKTAAVSTLVGAAVFVFMEWQAASVARLFLPDHTEAIALTIEVAGYVSWSMLFMPVAMLGSMYFTALEQAGRSLFVAVSRGLVLPVLGLVVFPSFWGAAGIWITPFFTEVLAVLVTAVCLFWKQETKRERTPAPEPVLP